jgi:hypothetical integral membrane protein (TIGR02206 family)
VRGGLIAFGLLNCVAWQLWNWWAGIWSLAYTLPLHLCTLANLLAPLMLWRRSYTLYQVLYFWGMAGVTQALLTPDIGLYGFPHFVFIIFFTSHGATIASVLFAAIADGYRPYWRSIPLVALITIGFMAFAGLVNWLTGGNYLFIARPPGTASLIDFLGPWPWYILSLTVIGMAVFVVVYLPYALRDWLVQRVTGDGRPETGARRLTIDD